MYKINKSSNSIQKLEQKTFASLGFRERDNLQEWIEKQTNVLGEELLIIQKEFSGFDDTQERLDLLALDKNGALVVIENKLDDSGKDVTWQALKYVSYCSNLSKKNITKIFQDYLNTNDMNCTAEEKLSEFMDGRGYEEIVLNQGVSQRVILIAGKFRKETSTVLWLMNYKIQIQCFRATPYAMGDELFLNIEQIIPMKDAEDYMIGLADKAQDEIENKSQINATKIIRQEFWQKLLPAMNNTGSKLFAKVHGSSYHWMGAASGISRIMFCFGISKSFCQVELYIDRGDKDENEKIFDRLFY